MLHHGLAGAEGAGNGRRTTLGNGEHGVDDALTGGQRPLGGILLGVGAAHTDGPLLHHGELHFPALLGAEDSHGLMDGVLALGGHLHDGAAHFRGHHDLVEHHGGLRHGADDVAAHHLCAFLHGGGELPLLLGVQGGDFHTTGDAGAHLLHDLLQRALDAVVDALDHAGPQLDAHGSTGGDHFRARAETGGLLIDLDGGRVALHGQDLADQAAGTHADHVGHIGVPEAGGDHQRAGDFHNFTAQIR